MMTSFTVRNKLPTGAILEVIVEAATPVEALSQFWVTLAEAVGDYSLDDGATYHTCNLYTSADIAEMKASFEFVSLWTNPVSASQERHISTTDRRKRAAMASWLNMFYLHRSRSRVDPQNRRWTRKMFCLECDRPVRCEIAVRAWETQTDSCPRCGGYDLVPAEDSSA